MTNTSTPITTATYAILAAAVYDDNRGKVNKTSLPSGWTPFTGVPAPLDNTNGLGTGFSAQAPASSFSG